MKKEKINENAESAENEENRKRDNSPLVGLNEVYTSLDSVNFFVVNRSKTKLKNIVTNEIKQLEKEVSLLDILTGVVESEIDEKIIDDLRQYFNFAKQIGYNPQLPYDFQYKSNIKNLYNLSLFEKIQKVGKCTSDYIEF